MVGMQSLDIEPNGKPPRNPYGPGGSSGSSGVCSNTSRSYLMFGLAMFMIYSVGKLMLPASHAEGNGQVSTGDAAGGWGTEHHHPVIEGGSGIEKPKVWEASMLHTHDNKDGAADGMEFELREADLLSVLSPIVSLPAQSRPEYEKYSGEGKLDPERLLNDRNTPHGMAFDFMLNRDTRPLARDDHDAQMIQRFVVALIFYATGGKDDEDGDEEDEAGVAGGYHTGTGGWDTSTAHFLTGMHECHWVKKGIEDQFWAILSVASESDRMVGVTKCNVDMEVTEIRLGAFLFRWVDLGFLSM